MDGNNQYTASPVRQLKTNRGLLKYLLLGTITLGIYPLVVMSALSDDINTIAGKYDGKKTMHYCLLFFLIGPITGEIATLVWYHRVSNRIGDELRRRGIASKFGASSFWLWNVLGSLIVVGPFIYLYQLLSSMNQLAADYNRVG
jgi:hypothetical protein